MSGTLAVIGGTSGIGRQVVLESASKSDRIIAVGRDARRGERLEREASGASFVAGDLSTVEGTIRITAELARRGPIETLVLAAGVMPRRRVLTPDGFELNFAVHHVAQYVLLAHVRSFLAPDATIVSVNSAGHHAPLMGSGPVRLEWSDLEAAGGYDPFMAYSRGKLAALMTVFAFDRRSGSEFTINALHPGMVRTRIGRDFPRAQVALANAMSISVAKGAAPVLHLMDAGRSAGCGSYFDRFTRAAPSAASLDRDDQERLIAITAERTGISFD
ncbi:SDR family NAD(P)-dependent oxidoreductase [Microbacterium sp. LWH3-1.2]|uniref:SDR family NAD(P)-dependent oxidoreductase n=1 Tax=Microbacterium sp. LWH3-1.2 TaxID=3135256 RepID=UPI0034139401